MLVQVDNHGPLIIGTNYWDSELARAGKVFVSVNAGAIRVLLPPAAYGWLSDMRTAKECVLSRGPWSIKGLLGIPGAPHVETAVVEGVEIMWDDGSDSPFVLHLTPASFDMLPAEPEPGREWVCSTWTAKDGRPHKALERICHWRRVAEIPCLEPWKGNK